MQLVKSKPTVQITWDEKVIIQRFVKLIDELGEIGVDMTNDDVYELLLDISDGCDNELVNIERID